MRRRRINSVAVVLVLAGLLRSAAASTFDEAQVELSKGNHRAAVDILRPLVKERNPRAQGLMGLLLVSGQGVQKDVAEGIRLLNESASAGNSGAQAMLAILLWEGEAIPQDVGNARALAEQSAVQSNPMGQMVLGSILVNELAEADRATGVEWLRKSVAQRFPLSEYQLGKLAMLGWIVAKDREGGIAMMERGASQVPKIKVWAELMMEFQPRFDDFRQGTMRQQCDSVLCAGKWGANRSEAKGFFHRQMWPELAALTTKIGFKTDQTYFYLGRSAEGMGLLPAASNYYEAAVRDATKCAGLMNNCDGLDIPRLASARLDGVRERISTQRSLRVELEARAQRERIANDAVIAAQLQRETEAEALRAEIAGAEAGDFRAQRELSQRFFNGVGVPLDSVSAVTWLRRAAEGGNREAQASLGERLLHGRQVPRDERLGEYWLKQASDRGDVEAAALLRSVLEERRQKAQDLESARVARRKEEAEMERARQRLEHEKRDEQEKKRRSESAAKVKSL